MCSVYLDDVRSIRGQSFICVKLSLKITELITWEIYYFKILRDFFWQKLFIERERHILCRCFRRTCLLYRVVVFGYCVSHFTPGNFPIHQSCNCDTKIWTRRDLDFGEIPFCATIFNTFRVMHSCFLFLTLHTHKDVTKKNLSKTLSYCLYCLSILMSDYANINSFKTSDDDKRRLECMQTLMIAIFMHHRSVVGRLSIADAKPIQLSDKHLN